MIKIRNTFNVLPTGDGDLDRVQERVRAGLDGVLAQINSRVPEAIAAAVDAVIVVSRTFVALAATGSIDIPQPTGAARNLRVLRGDQVLAVVDLTAPADQQLAFEVVISVDDKIAQTDAAGGALVGHVMALLVLRRGT